jgi:Tfp pilus assembly protein FimV
MDNQMIMWGLVGALICVVVIFAPRKTSGGTSGDVDPIAEAEVYVAYGREAQAIEMLEKAAAKFPQRTDIAQKLRELKGQL